MVLPASLTCTTFWQDSVSFSAHLAHLPSPVTVFSSSARALSTNVFVKPTTTAAANNAFFIGFLSFDFAALASRQEIRHLSGPNVQVLSGRPIIAVLRGAEPTRNAPVRRSLGE